MSPSQAAAATVEAPRTIPTYFELQGPPPADFPQRGPTGERIAQHLRQGTLPDSGHRELIGLQ